MSRKKLAASTVWLILSVIGSITTTVWLVLLQKQDTRLLATIDKQAAEINMLRRKVIELSDDAETMSRRITSTEAQFWE
jgi:hypothetical protein